MNYPKFSLAMSVYHKDDPEAFKRALESVLIYQTVKPDEVILVADGPLTNEINFVINDFSNRINNFKVIRFEQNKGLGLALRRAVFECSNELIARMDSDDVSSPTRFEKQLKYFKENKNVDLLGSNITEFVGPEDNIVSIREVPQKHNDIVKYMKTRCPFNHMTVMFKRDAVLKAGNYQDWTFNEDYYLWIRMLENHANFSNLNESLVNVRIGEEMYGRRGGRVYFESEKALQDYMRKHKIITRFTYMNNVLKRYIVQILLPTKVRGAAFRILARKSYKE